MWKILNNIFDNLEEILKTDTGVWVNPSGSLLAYATFDDTLVTEHAVNAFIPGRKVSLNLQRISVKCNV